MWWRSRLVLERCNLSLVVLTNQAMISDISGIEKTVVDAAILLVVMLLLLSADAGVVVVYVSR